MSSTSSTASIASWAPELEMYLRACHQDLATNVRKVIEQKLMELKCREVSSKDSKKIVVLETYLKVLRPDNLPLSTSKGYIEAISPVFE